MPFCADCIQYYAELADKLYDEVAPVGARDVALVRKEPLGVVGAIVPWNYPLIIAAWKIGPALVAGNSVVLKPAEQSPLGALFLAGLAKQAGLPDGALNVVPGFGERAGKPLALHPDVDMIGFTGSTEVGKLMLIYSGESNMKRVSLECGGKSPHVVMPDADMRRGGRGDRLGHLLQSGRNLPRRLAGARAFLGPRRAGRGDRRGPAHADPARPSLRGGFAARRARRGAAHGARALLHRTRRAAKARGSRLGGKRAMRETGGYYVEPTILDDARNEMRIAQEEIFGPVVVVIPFEDEEEAIRLANDTIYGLGAAVWTSDMNAAHRLTRAIRAGTVWVNTYDRSSLTTPFGGFKQSGFGRDRSPHAIDKYMDFKTIWTAYK